MSYYISATYNGIDYPVMHYLYYTKRAAIAKYREKYNLKHKHITLFVE